MKKIWGYCRISQRKQSIERQRRNIKLAYPDAVLVEEAYTGTKLEGRKEFDKLLRTVRKDVENGIQVVIVFDSVSRMSRNAEEGFQLYQELYELGVELVFLKEPHINTQTYKEAINKQLSAVETGDEATNELMKAIIDGINRYMLDLAKKQIFLAFQQAEKEVQDLHQRTKEGMETARLAGRTPGPEKGRKYNVKKESGAKAAIRKHSKEFGGTLNDAECMKLVGVSRGTYYKYKKEMLEEQ